MTTPVALLSCCLLLGHGSVAAAQDLLEKPAPPAIAAAETAPRVGPLGRTSLVGYAHEMLRVDRARDVQLQDCARDNGTWMERHPVWAGALVGFGTGALLTYAVTHDNNEGELFKVMSPGAGAVIWGSVSAGVGALAGWGIGRNREDGGCRGH